MKQSTLAIHSGSASLAGVPPSSGIPAFPNAAGDRSPDSRDSAAEGLERQIAALEGGDRALACSSGMAALYVALLAALDDRPRTILAANVMFGQTYRLMRLMGQQGVRAWLIDMCRPDSLRKALDAFDVGCILFESISNPLLRVPPMDTICEIARDRDVPVVVDATFTTPILNRPLELGAAYAVHSVTKYIAGHGDVLGGIVACRNARAEALDRVGSQLGTGLDPFQCFLAMRGAKTLPMRMEEHCRNAAYVADVLKDHPRVGPVYFPGLEGHPDKAVAERLLARGPNGEAQFGGMISFELLDADESQVFRFMNALRMVVRTLSLGDVHSLVTHPATTTHRKLGPKRRGRMGIRDSLVRLSVGIEDPRDITRDLVQAMESIDRA